MFKIYFYIYKLDIRWYKFVNKWLRFIIITYNLLIIFSKKKKKLLIIKIVHVMIKLYTIFNIKGLESPILISL